MTTRLKLDPRILAVGLLTGAAVGVWAGRRAQGYIGQPATALGAIDWGRVRSVAISMNRESLLTEHDDEVVVLVAGDRTVLEFSAPPDPELGRTRTYFLRVSGWAKEGSFHNATGRFIEPLPYRGMESYPPDAREVSASRRAYLDTYQTREVRG